MTKNKAMYIRIDMLTELLLAHMVETQKLNKSEVVRKAIYHYALTNVDNEEFNSLVQCATDMDRL